MIVFFFSVRPSSNSFVLMYGFTLVQTSLSAILFALAAPGMAEYENQWLYLNYWQVYVGIVFFSFIFGLLYCYKTPEKREVFQSLKLKFESNGEMSQEARSDSVNENQKYAFNLILITGFLLMAFLSIKMGRAEGLLFSTFLIALFFGPYLLAILIANFIQFFGLKRH